MIPPDEEWQLDTRRLGRRVFFYHTLDSTNNLVLRWAEQGAEEGLAVLAGEQTAGRGQHGRSWQSLPGAGVLLSLLVQSAGDRPAILTAWAAAGVCRLIRSLVGRSGFPAGPELPIAETAGPGQGERKEESGWKTEPTIKWPNDVLLAGHKVCGILTERVVRGSSSFAVVGIGLNVWTPRTDLARLGLHQATSLQEHTDQSLETRSVARQLILHLDDLYDDLCANGPRAVETAWREGLHLEGRMVLAETAGGLLRGLLVRLGLEEIRLRTESAEMTLLPEAIRHLEVWQGG
jgi:BirA family biotin operon repressor/biotin-[acetyl-CoA-carboxylase] ligase